METMGRMFCNHCKEEHGAMYDCRAEQRKPGRPPGSTSTRPIREVIKQIRFTALEWQAISAAAAKEGKPVANAQRRALAVWAERVLK